jgi:3-methyl-2-oxobutanoate hydroxymethyltransferase
MSSWPTNRRTSTADLQAAKERGEPWPMLTSYDSLTAAIFEEAGIPVLLVGDSAAMVVLGHDNTVPITVDQMIAFSAAVVRATKSTMIIGDLPFGSYSTVEDALSTGTRFFKEGGVGALKLEGCLPEQVEALVGAGMPVMAHVGLTPQSVHTLGGFKVQGRGEAGNAIAAHAKQLESAGAFAVVLEAVPADLAASITASLSIPTIGIGAGSGCDAQVLVWQDMCGLTTGKAPKFVRRYANIAESVGEAAGNFANDVRNKTFPAEAETY